MQGFGGRKSEQKSGCSQEIITRVILIAQSNSLGADTRVSGERGHPGAVYEGG